jgi:hypothetical protein
MTIRIYPTEWDKHMHAENGAPDWRQSARVLAESGYQVSIYEKRNEPIHVPFACDNDDELLACAWLVPGIDDDGPPH